MVEPASSERLAGRLEEVAHELARIDGIGGYGLGVAEGRPVVPVFTTGQLDPSDLRRLERWFGGVALEIEAVGLLVG